MGRQVEENLVLKPQVPFPEKCRREKCLFIKDARFSASTASAAPAWFHLSCCRGMVLPATVSDVCRWGPLEDKGVIL